MRFIDFQLFRFFFRIFLNFKVHIVIINSSFYDISIISFKSEIIEFKFINFDKSILFTTKIENNYQYIYWFFFP